MLATRGCHRRLEAEAEAASKGRRATRWCGRRRRALSPALCAIVSSYAVGRSGCWNCQLLGNALAIAATSLWIRVNFVSFITAAANPKREPSGKSGCVVLNTAYCPEVSSCVVLTRRSVGHPGNLDRVTASVDLMAAVVALMVIVVLIICLFHFS